MNSALIDLHGNTLDTLAATYEQRGYSVLKDPSPDQVPFDLDGYRPDLVAVKGDSHLIVEVKTSAARISVDRLQSLAQEISRHPGWRFLLVTLDDVDVEAIPASENELPNWLQLEEKLSQAKSLVNQGAVEPALLYLWSIFESALRMRAIARSIPVERLPADMLLKHLYSQGEVPVDDIDFYQEFMSKRNRLTHGAQEKLDQGLLRTLISKLEHLFAEWQQQPI